MKYKIGDKVKLKSKEGLDELKRQVGDLYIQPDAYKNAGSEQTILECNEDFYRYDTSSRFWHESLFEGLVEEPITLNGKEVLLKLAGIELPSGTTTIWDLPNGYIFKDENGNVINATKIILEKKRYPKTYKECCAIIGAQEDRHYFYTKKDKEKDYPHEVKILKLLDDLRWILICRDAYWQIAGEEMGLGKPWKPEFGGECYYHISVFNYKVDAKRGFHGLTNCTRNTILAFPTEEMRDAFYENFKELINECKELL